MCACVKECYIMCRIALKIEIVLQSGLGWNSTIRKFDCSDEWWERKLKEKPEAKKLRFKGLSPLVEERWDHLFGDTVATGTGCVAPSLSQEFIDQTVNEVEEVQDREGGTVDFSQYSTRLRSLEDRNCFFFKVLYKRLEKGTFHHLHRIISQTPMVKILLK